MASDLHVAVIGGGTGGLCLAQGLHRAGVSVAVYERSHTRAERLQGYRVHINPDGSRALHECLPSELWEAFLATCGGSGGDFGFVTEQLRQLLVIEDDTTVDPAEGHHSVSRITLHQLLSSGLDSRLHYGKEFERYERSPDGTITCYFADGSTATADVLVGADGGGSRVRRQYLPHAERVDTGVLAIMGKYPLTEGTKRPLPEWLHQGTYTIIPPKACGMFTATHEVTGRPVAGIGGNDDTLTHDAVLFDNTSSYLMWAFVANRTWYPAGVPRSGLDGAALRDVTLDLIKDWHPALRTMVAESPPATVTQFPIWTAVPVDHWPSTNVTLLGDAIHSMTPFRGIGANTALRDAKILCRNLVAASHASNDIQAAIAAYERQMVDYGFTAVRDSLRGASQFISNRPTRLMMKTVLRLVNAVPPLKRRMVATPPTD